MVKQGDIILVSFDPTKGREQAGERPALVISNTKYNFHSGFALACPITKSERTLNMRVKLDDSTKTQGDIICEQVRIIDLHARNFKIIESIPKEIYNKVYSIINTIIMPMK